MRVEASNAMNMIGPYLACEATCPTCGMPNILAHVETDQSPVKPVVICSHIRSVEWDEEGSRFVNFS